MITELKAAPQPLTEALAVEFSKMECSPGERPLSEKRVAYHAQRIERGEYHTPTWSFAWFGGKKVRVDGQHSSTALARANGKFPKGKSVFVREFAVDCEQDLAELFRRFDNPESVRPPSQAMAAHSKCVVAVRDIAGDTVRRATGAVALFHELTKNRKTSTDDRCRLVYTHQDWIKTFASLYCKAFRCGVTVAAAIYGTFEKDPEASVVFWELVKSEAEPNRDAPTRVLARWLRDIGGGSPVNIRVQKFSKAEVYERCTHAWNAWRSGKTTHSVKSYTRSKASGLVLPK